MTFGVLRASLSISCVRSPVCSAPFERTERTVCHNDDLQGEDDSWYTVGCYLTFAHSFTL